MNWLAHVFLSPKRIEYQLGNILADPLKGKCWEEASEDLCKGMRLHQVIDSFTDAHPEVHYSKKLLTHKGALKGVALDILYDHFLSVHWKHFSTKKRERFLNQFRIRALKASGGYPSEAKSLIQRVVENRQLDSYAQMQGVKEAFMRIDNRLSEGLKRKDGMMGYLSLIEMHKAELEASFLRFFPELMQRVREEVPDALLDHWKVLL
ncbi:MAG: ACP phosphodiesterase [Sulfurovum sp.]|nr:ACP phosphodiesterase [Sulfurovum sp.]